MEQRLEWFGRTGTKQSASIAIPDRNTLAGNVFGRCVTICITQAGSQAGYTFSTKITADDGAGMVTMLDACPFVGA